MGGFGLILVLGCCIEIYVARRFIIIGEKAPATVQEIKKYKIISADGEHFGEIPIIKFTTTDYQQVVTSMPRVNDRLQYKLEQKLGIYYLPADPQSNLCLESEVWRNSFFKLFLGVIITLIGLGKDISKRYNTFKINDLTSKGCLLSTPFLRVEN